MDQKNKKHIMILGIVIGAMLLILVAVLVAVSVSRNSRNKLDEMDPFDIALTFGDDPKTQKNFSWYTVSGPERSIVEYYPLETGEAATDKFDRTRASSAEGFTETIDTYLPKEGDEYSASAVLEPKSFTRHAVFVSGLSAGKKYVYRVGDGTNWSSPGLFTTAPDSTVSKTEGFSFIIVSDVQGFVYSDYELWAKVFRKSSEMCSDPAFMVNLGDFVERQDNALVWKYYFDLPEGLRNVTTVPVIGNKDDKMFMKYFLLGTKDGVNGLNGYYSFDYMNVHFTVLNTGDGSKDLSKAQVKWLKRDLESANAKNAAFRVVLIHKAPYSDRNHADDSEIVEIRAQLLPVFDEYGVDVVLEGHDHYYFRSEPVTDNGTAVAGYTASVVNSRGESVNVFTLTGENGVPGGLFYFMPGASGVKQHNKSFRDMPEILTARSIIVDDPTFCICDVTEDHIYFYTYSVDRYRSVTEVVECWGIGK